MLATGVIEPSISSWASPVCLVKKKGGTFRFCIDYRRVNAVPKKDAYPIPDIQDAFDNLRGARYFATIDTLRLLAAGNDRQRERAICFLYQAWFISFYAHAFRLVRCARIVLSPYVHSTARLSMGHMFVLFR